MNALAETTIAPAGHPGAQNALREILREVRDFIDAHRARFHSPPAGWADHWEKSLAFHAVNGTLACVWTDRQLAGVAIAWRLRESEIYLAEAGRRSVFDWRGNNPDGDSVYLALVCTNQPHALSALARYYLDRWPDWAGLKQFCHRRGCLRPANGLLSRLATGHTIRKEHMTYE